LTSHSRLSGTVLLAVSAAVATIATRAEDVEKKWRLSAAVGGFNSYDSVDSNASNVLTVESTSGNDTIRYFDPRNDSDTFGSLDLQAGPVGTIAVQYALTPLFLIEGSVGYHRADFGDVEVSAEFSGTQPPIPEITTVNFQAFRIEAGEIERVPIQLDGVLRFRPRAKFNPYIGAGLGYAYMGYEPSSALDEVSLRLDSSLGRSCRVLADSAIQSCQGPLRNLEGATVAVEDGFEWNLTAGAEYSFKRKMAAFVDVRWIDASREIGISFDGGSELGVSVPQLTVLDTSPVAQTAVRGGYGAVSITSGGLLDGGVLWVEPGATVELGPCVDPLSLACAQYCAENITSPGFCQFSFLESPGTGNELVDINLFLQTGIIDIYTDEEPGIGDGRVDPGRYFVQGGKLSYDGLSFQVGFRYTF
jgi:outer membrane protein W